MNTLERRHSDGSPAMNAPALDTERLEKMYYDLVRVRRFDERVIELFNAGAVKGTAHSCVGQEAIAVGACAALRENDYIATHHRGHGHTIAKGADMTRMMAELLGRETGYCGGLGGSMHIADLERGILGANGIVGAGMGLATGAALSAMLRKSGQIALAFFGDGAANEGIFHEALNVASLWKLPVIYFCENNQYGLTTSMAESTAIDRLSRRAAGYSMPGETIDGNDIIAVFDAVFRAAERARSGGGPTLIEALTYRWGDHSMRANLPQYRTQAEETEWRERSDPLARMVERLTGRQVREERIVEIRTIAGSAVETAIEAATTHAEPIMASAEAAVMAPLKDFGPEPGVDSIQAREISYVEAIREAIDQELTRDNRVFVMGEDVGKTGGIFACTRGLAKIHGLRSTARYAHLGKRDFRHGCRRGYYRNATDRRDTDLRFCHVDDGQYCQSGCQIPLHVGRQADAADCVSRSPRGRHTAWCAAFAIPGGLVLSCARPCRHSALDAL